MPLHLLAAGAAGVRRGAVCGQQPPCDEPFTRPSPLPGLHPRLSNRSTDAAPAHHFKDRTGLLTAIAAEGYGLLAATLTDAADLKDAGVRYVRFAREHPAHFQVMFTPELLRGNDLELTTARALAGERLRDAVSAVPPEGRGTDARLAGVAAWSLAHGFATLLLSHNLDGPVGDQDPEEVFRLLSDLLFQGSS
ncbi:TetR-like C-terminal domain-containing protein [Streptomyces sp. ActVer]|uniref:TetR-like C-terminal domain-containing protein n=1 Tax=Streptomyces sp. ActVer TaxID=3014558 RepID=UPI0022B4AFAE|nr:TetR-like C-terminal domain-containing protein [Streptomyces sp. ActVer]MCZ4514402.1 TetR-like C-terminal domain-containing protein [Streptomyces sp. ActVer]